MIRSLPLQGHGNILGVVAVVVVVFVAITLVVGHLHVHAFVLALSVCCVVVVIIIVIVLWFRTIGSLVLFPGFLLLVHALFHHRFVEVFLAVFLDFLLLLLVDIRWIFDTVVFEVGVHKLLCNLGEDKSQHLTREWELDILTGSTYVFGMTLQVIFRELVLEFIQDIFDVREQLDRISMSHLSSICLAETYRIFVEFLLLVLAKILPLL